MVFLGAWRVNGTLSVSRAIGKLYKLICSNKKYVKLRNLRLRVFRKKHPLAFSVISV